MIQNQKKKVTLIILAFTSLILISFLLFKTKTDWLSDYFEKSYTVVLGDSYWSIAKEQLGSPKKLKELQDLNDGTALKVGQKLKLPAKKKWSELFD